MRGPRSARRAKKHLCALRPTRPLGGAEPDQRLAHAKPRSACGLGMSTAQKFTVGETVWAHAGGDVCFQKGKIERFDTHKGTVNIRLAAGPVDIKEADVHKTNAEKQDGLPDNTYLRELNEATLLHNLKYRYNSKDDGGCYSVTGHILIAINPFRKLNVYTENNVRTLPVARGAAVSRRAAAPRSLAGGPAVLARTGEYAMWRQRLSVYVRR